MMPPTEEVIKTRDGELGVAGAASRGTMLFAIECQLDVACHAVICPGLLMVEEREDIQMRKGGGIEAFTYNRTRLKTPRTLRSSVFWLFQSSNSSNGPPQLLAALAMRMSTPFLFDFRTSLSTSPTNFWIWSVWPTFAAMGTALPAMPEIALSWSAAEARFVASRAVIITREHPAWRSAADA